MKKNKKQLRLEDALVPVEEQPYEVPENWCWTKLGVNISISKEKTDDFSDTSVKYVGLEHLESNKGLDGYGTTEGIKSLKNIFHTGQILYGKLRPYLNKHDIASFDGVCSTDILVIDVKNVVDAQFVNKFLDMDSFISYTVNNSKGINLPRVSGETIMDAAFPLPPLPEQQRIVERIESLFSKLDEAKEKAQEAVHSFDNRKTMIIHNAFQGTYTEKWRKDNNIDIGTWQNLTLNDVAEYKKGPFGSSITKAMFVPKGKDTFKVYEQGNAIRKTIEYGHYYIPKEKYNELKGFSVQSGDIIISCAGTIGEVYKLPKGCEQGVINQALMRVRIFDIIDEGFFVYYFGEVLKGDVNEQANGTAIKNIPPFKIMKAMEIKLPGLSEQKEIVHFLNTVLAKEEHVKKLAEILIDKIDLMKKSILAMAFRGELGTNNPDEESSVGLLNSIIDDENK